MKDKDLPEAILTKDTSYTVNVKTLDLVTPIEYSYTISDNGPITYCCENAKSLSYDRETNTWSLNGSIIHYCPWCTTDTALMTREITYKFLKSDGSYYYKRVLFLNRGILFKNGE